MESKDSQSVKSALKISALYLIFGLLWIYFSDSVVELFSSGNPHQLTLLQHYKGGFFIVITTFLLFLLMYRFLHKGFIEYTQRISEQKAAHDRLAQQDTLLRTIVNSSPDAIFAKDMEGRYMLFNSGAGELVNISPENVIGHTDKLLFSSEAAKKIQEIDRLILAGGVIQNHEEDVITASGKQKYFWVTKGPLLSETGKTFGIFGISRDITTIKENEQAIIKAKEHFDYMAHHDLLTELPNRTSLIEKLQHQTSGIENHPFALLFLDLDGFKEINDSYGHRFGDELLVRITQLLQELFPPDTFISRSGGDEFVILLSCHKDKNIIHNTMFHLIDTLNNPFHIDEIDVYITASIGITMYPSDASSAEELLQKADAAMYNAKNMGRNTYSFYDLQFTEKALHRTTIATQLKKAIQNHELELYFQPQIDIQTENIIGMEALLRWTSFEEMISPAVFIPIAEESGLILQVGEFVLMQGCKTAAQWAKKGFSYGRLAINVSARQLTHIDFLMTLDRIIQETQCDPTFIELEITESSILENPEQMIALLDIIQAKGFSISIDDFGTGYSSLSYLKNLPIDKLKIDISFVRNITHEAKNQSIVKTIIALAKGLGMTALAEGVETLEELNFLRANGIDSIQGYYYYKPMSFEKAEELFLKH